ncbi:MAG: hypothetical protein ACTH9L_09250, partial [Microbacterium gubbeenense]
DAVRDSARLYLGFYAGCLLGLLPGAALVGALTSPRGPQEWAVVAGGALAGGAAFVTVAAVCGYFPARKFASKSGLATAQKITRISVVALAVGLVMAIVVGIITHQFVLGFWMVTICLVWCLLPGVGLAWLLSRSAVAQYSVIGGVAVLAVIGMCFALLG